MGQLVSDVTEIMEYKKNKKELESQRQQVLKKMADDEKEKTNLVKKTLAAQRAKYGASGMSTKGMSEGAVLKRLQEEVEEPFNTKRRDNLAKLSTLKAKKPNYLKMAMSHFDKLIG